MNCNLFHVDAFTDRPFAGNPAAVCLLDEPADEAWMQQFAAEMNLSETAYVVPRTDEGSDLRWFTPAVEVALCGHATLASAAALWHSGRASPSEPIRFHTRSGMLTCSGEDGWIAMDFPSTPPVQCEAPQGLLESLDVQAQFIGKNKMDYFVHVSSEDIVRAIQPDFRNLKMVSARGVIVTAVSTDPMFDFVSRFFAPAVGVDEDPVTGSAHCCLGPYWSAMLGRREMLGNQASKRGGMVRVTDRGPRVVLAGKAVIVTEGQVALDPATA
jgi:predicted PhzF superfamily epimerase YddE/YHI9